MRMNSRGQTHDPSVQQRRAGWAVLAAALCLGGSTGTVAVGQCQAVPAPRTPPWSKKWAGRISWIVDVQTIPAPPPPSSAMLILMFLLHCPGHADLRTSPVPGTQPPGHPATGPTASPVPAELRLQPYKGNRGGGPGGSCARPCAALRPWAVVLSVCSLHWPWQHVPSLQRGRYGDWW